MGSTTLGSQANNNQSEVPDECITTISMICSQILSLTSAAQISFNTLTNQ
jgi:hypothetical protein